jgi:hypothetical protein
MKISVESPQKTTNELSKLQIDPAIPLFGIYPKHYKPTYNKDICTPFDCSTIDAQHTMNR